MIKSLLLVMMINSFGLIMCSKDNTVTTQAASPGSGKAGSTARFTIVGNYLYALDGNDIVSYNISTGNSPVFQKRILIANDIETIYPYNDMLFIGAATGMYAYGLTNPTTPNKLSVVRHVRSCDPVVVQNNYAYVTLRAGTVCGGGDVLNVYDVTNVFAPILIKTINIPSPYGLGVNGTALYITFRNGIRVFNIHQPANPLFVKDIAEQTASDVIPYNNTLIVQLSKGASFYDISSALQPTFISRIN